MTLLKQIRHLQSRSLGRTRARRLLKPAAVHAPAVSRNERGFTLPEAVVVVAIIGMMLVLALPYFAQTMRRSRLTSEARQIFMPLLKARLEAIKRGNNVNVEISTDSSKASYRTAIVYVDGTTGGTAGAYDPPSGGPPPTSPDTLIATFPMAPSSEPTLGIDGANAASPSTAAQTIEFIFTPLGTLDTANSTTDSVYVSDSKGNVLQVAVPSGSNAKATMTKRVTGTTYEAQPWHWS